MHMIMDGRNYRRAVELHRGGVQEEDIRRKLAAYRELGIAFLRDGGDALGVSARTAQLAPEYGIDYRTPAFAIHKAGHYGGIVGRGFYNMKEYHALVLEAAAQGCGFIKAMFSGIMDFGREGAMTEEPLEAAEIREMIHIAHEEGFAVMAHVNGARAVQAAVEAGVDSVEHGNFVDEECLQAMVQSRAVWVPTFVTITNLIGSGRFDDASLRRLEERQGRKIRRGFELGVKIALGSDAGAYRVLHGQGILDEYEQMRRLTGVCSAGRGADRQDVDIPEADERSVGRRPVNTKNVDGPEADERGVGRWPINTKNADGSETDGWGAGRRKIDTESADGPETDERGVGRRPVNTKNITVQLADNGLADVRVTESSCSSDCRVPLFTEAELNARLAEAEQEIQDRFKRK